MSLKKAFSDPLIQFFLLTFTLSWICFISVAILSYQDRPSPVIAPFSQLLVFLGIISPSLTAIWITFRQTRPGGMQALLNRIGRWQVNIGWYLFAVAYFPVVKLTVAVLHWLITGSWPVFGREPWYLMALGILISTWVQAGEEIGWRGFALPRLTKKSGLSLASVLLGMIWAFWHLPLFFVKGADTFGQSFPLYLMQVTGVSVAIGWLYWKTGGSLLLVMLMHAAVNQTKNIVPSAVPGAADPFALSNSLASWLTLLLIWVCAVYFLSQMRNTRSLHTDS